VARTLPRGAPHPPAGSPVRRRAVGAAAGRDAARAARAGVGRSERAVRLMAAPSAAPVPTEAGWFGHPRGLSTLFFTEMWERFSYYGMRGFLILYATAAAATGGLGFDVRHGASIRSEEHTSELQSRFDLVCRLL